MRIEVAQIPFHNWFSSNLVEVLAKYDFYVILWMLLFVF
jgi:hypothetical protein